MTRAALALFIKSLRFFKAKRNSANDNNLVTCITINVLNSWLLTKPNLLTLVRKNAQVWILEILCGLQQKPLNVQLPARDFKLMEDLLTFIFLSYPFLVNLLYCFVVYLGRLSDQFGKTYNNIETTLGQLRDNFKTTLGLIWDNWETALQCSEDDVLGFWKSLPYNIIATNMYILL